MKITKYLHSCLVFELNGFKLLFDPGKFSFAEGEVSPQMFADVQGIVITHIHPDHLDIENLKKIIALSNATVYTNTEVGNAITKAGITFNLIEEGVYPIGPFKLQAFPVQHEPLLDNPIPQMTGFIINDKVLHPVDSMEAKLTAYQGIELLLMVTMAPFTNELRIAAFADIVKPKQILPVHDGYAKAFFIEQRYQNYKKHFSRSGIKFNEIYQVGDSITI
ncbi:MBL fold metallo-hydrolase [Mucilaginibacter phyllosphaerae]|uniref:L-ascorbate metabolism protein UlaG (Beta-lactamase superfamily) n=1 Tax=Mucilaginibacter phyllosphaerae TaxID=1812349 RepID=A0A4Y8AJA1_9SPHI|nr:MBL fold metallo-hydrolase [Mucilaginibacter phyllosphaerae]MBB3967850.1 L-ascorbate metabolism protein UlaG (beta-lactamase superfamily) [Mucilaginibacter phyllosphaerae]TEW69106.1 MBL fold metallo-hydrolase [Mucilaginibacter phyllosphaerae]GGH02879.1 Zn-dependent hydrolase [Mucilaginibacter phyllosphaerae]